MAELPNGEQRRNNGTLIELRVGRRGVPVTRNFILGAITILTFLGTCADDIPWPWRTHTDDIAAIANHLAKSDSINRAAIDTVRAQHLKTREDIAEMRTNQALSAQALCALTRRFAPETSPAGCTPAPRGSRNPRQGF